jgi:ABC-type lipoprotein export system ATPase subunit
MIIQLKNVSKIYNKSTPHIKALDNINLEIKLQEKVLITGDSGA